MWKERPELCKGMQKRRTIAKKRALIQHCEVELEKKVGGGLIPLDRQDAEIGTHKLS